MIATASKSLRRKVLAAANARAVLALSRQPTHSVALNERGTDSRLGVAIAAIQSTPLI